MRLTIKLTRWEHIKDDQGRVTGGRSVPDGTRSGDVELEIDEDGLMQMLGDRALRNKSRKAAIAGGLIVARVVNVKDARLLRGPSDEGTGASNPDAIVVDSAARHPGLRHGD